MENVILITKKKYIKRSYARDTTNFTTKCLQIDMALTQHITTSTLKIIVLQGSINLTKLLIFKKHLEIPKQNQKHKNLSSLTLKLLHPPPSRYCLFHAVAPSLRLLPRHHVTQCLLLPQPTQPLRPTWRERDLLYELETSPLEISN